jgi:general secretion pathway protein H
MEKAGADHQRSSSRGFTLLELLVVLGLATLLIAMVPPLISAALPGTELKSSVRRLAAGLRLAREEAIRGGRDVALTVDLKDSSYQVDGPFRRVSFPKGLELQLEVAGNEMLDDQRGAIRFFPDGASTGGRIILSRSGSGWQVGAQWLTGRVEIAPWDGP